MSHVTVWRPERFTGSREIRQSATDTADDVYLHSERIGIARPCSWLREGLRGPGKYRVENESGELLGFADNARQIKKLFSGVAACTTP